MIKCILPDNPTLTELTTKTLSQFIKAHWPDAKLTLITNEKYWKYENTRYLIYNISNTGPIYIRELIKHFDLDWWYLEDTVYAIEKKQSVVEEEAVWNKNCHPNATFLIPEIEWVHIYTWEDDDDSAISYPG
jgi:hypothetical protein